MVTYCNPPPKSTIIVGIILAIVGNVLISLSFQITKLAHNKNQHSQISYLKLPLWWVSVFTMAGGEVGNFLAYGYAPATIVSPLGAVSVIFNAILSKFFLQEANTWSQYLGVVFALGGSVGVVLGAPYSCEVEVTVDSLLNLLQQPAAIVFFVCILGITVSLGFLVKKSWMEEHVLGYTLICGLLGAITVMSSKGVSTGFRDAFAGNPEWFRSWLVYLLILAMLGSIFFQMKYLNMAMIAFGSSQVVPVYFVLFVVSSVTAGMILYDEYNWGDATKCVGFFVGLAVTFFGVYLVGKKDVPSKQGREKLLGDQHSIEVSIAEYPDENAGQICNDDVGRPRSSCSRASIESTGSNESMGSMKEFLVAVAKHVATPAKVVGKGIASNMVKAGATALAMGGAPLNWDPSASAGMSSSPPSK